MAEWDEKENKLYEKLRGKNLSLAQLRNISQTDWGDKEESDLEKVKRKAPRLPKNIVVLGEDESMMEPGVNAKPFKYTVKKGDTLKSIAKKFSVSYGELSNHLMNTEGTTSIYEEQEIEIPRHFLDLSMA